MKWHHIIRSVTALAAAATLVSGLASCSRAGDREATANDATDTPVFKDGKLLPLKDGFPKSPLSIIIIDEAGSNDGCTAGRSRRRPRRSHPSTSKCWTAPSSAAPTARGRRSTGSLTSAVATRAT